jgi:hypothetical protein
MPRELPLKLILERKRRRSGRVRGVEVAEERDYDTKGKQQLKKHIYK